MNRTIVFCLAALLFKTPAYAIQTKHLPAGWTIGGASPDYEAGIDNSVMHGGYASVYVKQIQSSRGMASLGQTFKADAYRGKRLRLSAYIRTRNVKSYAGLYMRVDSESAFAVATDTMQNRPIIGTRDWGKYEVVLDVPADGLAISIGLNLMGSGQAWIDDLSVETVGRNVPATGRAAAGARLSEAQRAQFVRQMQGAPSSPYNLDFERQGH